MTTEFKKHDVNYGMLTFQIHERVTWYPKYEMEFIRDDTGEPIPKTISEDEYKELRLKTEISPRWQEVTTGDRVERRFVSDVTVRLDDRRYHIIVADYTGQLLVGCHVGPLKDQTHRPIELWYPMQIGMGSDSRARGSRIFGFSDHVKLPAQGSLLGVPDHKMLKIYGQLLTDFLQRE